MPRSSDALDKACEEMRVAPTDLACDTRSTSFRCWGTAYRLALTPTPRR